MRIERKDNESLTGALSRAKRHAKVGDAVMVMRDGRCESAWDRIRKEADGSIWQRRNDAFRFDTKPQTPALTDDFHIGGWGR